MPIVSTFGFSKERLEAAVKARGLSWSHLAEAADIRNNTLSDYKLGKTTPSPDQLSKLAGALDFPEHFFVKPPSSNVRLVGPRLFRASAALTKRVANQAEATLEWIAECLEFAERWLKLPEPKFLSEYEQIKEPFALKTSDVEALAISVREKLGYGRAPVSKFVRTLERNGIAILRCETLGTRRVKIDGLSQHTAKRRPLIAIFASDEPCLSREYFSLAHELGHLVLHSQLDEKRFENPLEEKLIEDQANRFASAFLLPQAQFFAELYAPTLKAFEFQKRKWKASISAMIRRCFDLGLIDRAKYSSLNVQMSQRGWRTKEPLDDVFDVEQPILLKQAFETLVKRERVPLEQIKGELPFLSRDLSLISGLPVDFFEPPEPDPSVLTFPSRRN